MNASKGFRFEISYILSRLRTWLTLGVESVQQEGWSDVELFFASGSRRLIQIKDHALTRSELAETLNEFGIREHSFKYEEYVIATAGLTPTIERLARQIERYRDLERHTDAERARVVQAIETTLQKLKLANHRELILQKLIFDNNLSSLRDPEFCREVFLGGLLSSYRITVGSAENILLRMADLLSKRHGKVIRLSVLKDALRQAELENEESSLANFRLIRKEFLDSVKQNSSNTFFYLGAAPTWSDILNGRDIPREVAGLIKPVLDQTANDKIFLPLVAEAGEGKSTVLRRLAVGLVNDNKPVLFLDASATTADPKEVQRIARIVRERVYVFIDEAAKIHNLNGFLQSISELPILITIIAAARPYEMSSVRSAYVANMTIASSDNDREYTLEGLSDGEIDLLVEHLLRAKLLCLPRGVQPAVASEAIKQQTDRKFLVLAIELTQGAKVIDIVRDEIERVRKKGEKLLAIYRYICLMASVDSFITVSMIKDIVRTNSVKLDVASELIGLVTIEGEKLYPRHNRIGEIATEIFFKDQDDERADNLCTAISTAIKHEQYDVIESAVRISHSVPSSQVLRVVNHVVDEAYRIGQTKLIEDVVEEFEWHHESTELFLQFLTSKTPFFWRELIFPNGPDLDWGRIEEVFEVSFKTSPEDHRGAIHQHSKESFRQIMKWAQIYSLAAWHVREQTPLFVALTRKIYEILQQRYPDQEFEICLAHGEFLSDQWRQEETAISFYQRALALRPESAEAHAGIALAFYMTENYYPALIHYKAAMRIDSQSIFRVVNGSLFDDEFTKRLLELEDYVEFKKALIKHDFGVGRGFQNMISRNPAIMVNLKKQTPEAADTGFAFYNRMDYRDEVVESLKWTAY